jgi:activator of 2-hydroxyglutaryl-CoA dehydratase
MEEKLGQRVNISKEPQIVGALGAALIAWQNRV